MLTELHDANRELLRSLVDRNQPVHPFYFFTFPFYFYLSETGSCQYILRIGIAAGTFTEVDLRELSLELRLGNRLVGASVGRMRPAQDGNGALRTDSIGRAHVRHRACQLINGMVE